MSDYKRRFGRISALVLARGQGDDFFDAHAVNVGRLDAEEDQIHSQLAAVMNFVFDHSHQETPRSDLRAVEAGAGVVQGRIVEGSQFSQGRLVGGFQVSYDFCQRSMWVVVMAEVMPLFIDHRADEHPLGRRQMVQ